MNTALATKPLPTLVEAEEYLQALLDTQDVADDNMRAELDAEIMRALQTAAAKRDRVAGALAHAESRIDLIDQEIDRLKAMRDQVAAVKDRIEGMVATVIMSLGADEKGRFPKLQGNTSSLSLQRNPASVEIVDADRVPPKYKTVKVTFRQRDWNDLVAAGIGVDYQESQPEVRKSEIKQAIEVLGHEISGARMAPPKYRVVRK